MKEHLSFDEIVNFIYANRIDKNYKLSATRINSHICSCMECYKMYDAVLETRNTTDSLCAAMTEKERMQVRILKALYQQEKDEKLESLMENLKKQIGTLHPAIHVCIESLKEISALPTNSSFSFFHPLRTAAVKAHGRTSENQESKVRSVLVDASMNRISISQDCSLSIRLDNSQCNESRIIFLLMKNSMNTAKIGVPRSNENGKLLYIFDDIKPGEYEILI
ncbi:MAG TPA: hypothetical protein DIW17_06930 [Clostridiales bacterium]|nr:hypothetical protein [Clostridia bacterium]MDD4680634.1 hypothetical protein [Clostridia bacterium]HCS73590.1 hypothetical protein [Clostridiales bacterium]